jgi:hypothetical protein
MKITWVIRDGQLTNRGTLLLGIVGASLIAYTLLFAEIFWLGLLSFFIGCGLLGFAGLSNSATSIGLKPFTNDPLGWRKAKQSYKEDLSPEGTDVPPDKP